MGEPADAEMAAAKPQPQFSPHNASAAADAGTGPADADAGFAVFRLLLPPSFSDADAMRLYAAVNPLRRRTAALHVRLEPLDPADAAGGRVVATVLGPTAPVRRVEASCSSAAPLALSPVQEALVAVIDNQGALNCAASEEEEVARGKAPPGRVTCLLLVDADRFEASAGGGVMERIALEAGADVCVAMWEEGAQPPEEVVEITGDRAAVRKALVVLSSCLQGDHPFSNSTTYVKKEGSILPWASSEVPEPNMGTSFSEASTEFAQVSVAKTHCPEGNTGDVQSKTLQQVSFRLLLPIYLSGGLIGKKGLIIKGIEDETGACIDVGAPVTGCKEHVITICALESPDSHIVQSALLLIFDRMMEMESNTHSQFEKASQFSARALVLRNQIECLVGLGGSIIKELVNATGARIQILDDTDVPACASNFELVLQITGEIMNIRNALSLVCWKLRNHIFSNETDYNNSHISSSEITASNATNQENMYSTSQYSLDNAHKVDHGPSLSYGVDSVEKSFRALELSPPEIQFSSSSLVPRSTGLYGLPRLTNKSTKPSMNQLKKAKRRARKAHNRAHVNPKTNNTNPKSGTGFQKLGTRRFASLTDIDTWDDNTSPKDDCNTNPMAIIQRYLYLGLQTLDNSMAIIQRYLYLGLQTLDIRRFVTGPLLVDIDGPICHSADNTNPKDDNMGNTIPKVIVQRAGLFRPELHGMDNYEKELMEFLEHGTTPLMGILGMRGVGKTTLLKLMRTYYNQLSYFRYIFFVEAGKDFTIDMLSGVVSRDIGFGPIPVVDHISSFLRNQSFLLLLDDLQCAVDLTDAGLPMKLGPQQKIVFTTRDEIVLAEMGCVGNTFRMHCLDEVTAWNLFMYLVGDKIINSHPYIKDLAKKMVAECHGIPGALCTLGGLMSTKKNLEPWIVAHEMLVKSQSSCEIEETENEGYPCLQLLIDEI